MSWAFQTPPEHFVLLFLAHDGVYNADAWEFWKSFAPIDKVTFCVHAPPNVSHGQAFCDRYRLDSHWEKSGWCQPSIVRETIKALEATCQLFTKDGERVIINLVSGADIPVKPYTFLFRDRNYESVGDKNQWFSLKIEHVRNIVKTIKLDDWFGLTSVVNRYSGCPDEYVIWHVMDGSFMSRNLFDYYTVDWREPTRLESPAEWRSLTETKQVMMACVNINLMNLIVALRSSWSREDHGLYPIFLRKVVFEMDLGEEIMDMLYNPERNFPLVSVYKTDLFKDPFDCGSVPMYRSQLAKTITDKNEAFFYRNTTKQQMHEEFLKNNFNFYPM